MNGPTIATSTTNPASDRPIVPRRLRAARLRITSHSRREPNPAVLGAARQRADLRPELIALALRRGLANNATTSVVMFTNT